MSGSVDPIVGGGGFNRSSPMSRWRAKGVKWVKRAPSHPSRWSRDAGLRANTVGASFCSTLTLRSRLALARAVGKEEGFDFVRKEHAVEELHLVNNPIDQLHWNARRPHRSSYEEVGAEGA